MLHRKRGWVFAAAVMVSSASLASAVEVNVHVKSPAGKGVSDAKIRLLEASVDGEWLAEARTDEFGNALLEVEGTGRVRLVVTAAQWLSHVETIDYEAGDLIQVVLRRGRPVELTVKDIESGRAIDNYRVLLNPTSAGDDITLSMALLEAMPVKSEGGTVVLRSLPDEETMMLILADGYRPSMLIVAETQNTLLVEVDGRGCSRHQIVDGNSREAVAAVRAVPPPLLEHEGGSPGIGNLIFARSDDEGMITLCPLGGSKNVLMLDHPDYVPRSVILAGDDKLEPGAKIMMFQGASLHVRAHSALDEPVVDARVVVEIEGLRHERTTDLRGEARFDELAPSESAWIEVMPPGGFVPSATATTTLRAGETAKMSIFLPPEYRLRFSHDEQPLADTPIVLLDWIAGGEDGEKEEKIDPIVEGRSDGNGNIRFSLDSEPSDRALLAIGGENSFHFVRWPRPEPGSSTFDSREIEVAGTYVSGRIVAKNGDTTIGGARLTCVFSLGEKEIWQPQMSERGPLWIEPLRRQRWMSTPGVIAASDDRGRFKFFLPDHCDGLTVNGPPPQPDDAPWKQKEVKRSALEQPAAVIRLERGARFEVKIDVAAGDFSSSLDPSSLELLLWRWPDVGRASIITNISPERWVQTLDPPDEGPWLIVAKSPGFPPAVEGPIEATSGKVIPVSLRFEEGASILARHDGDVNPQSIRLTSAEGIDWLHWVERSPLTEEVFEIGPLPRGSYVLEYEGQTKRVDLRVPGQQLETRFPSSR